MFHFTFSFILPNTPLSPKANKCTQIHQDAFLAKRVAVPEVTLLKYCTQHQLVTVNFFFFFENKKVTPEIKVQKIYNAQGCFQTTNINLQCPKPISFLIACMWNDY